MEDVFFTKKSEETSSLGRLLAKELHGGEVVCLTGELGSGKTTFAQGILKGLGAKGPFTSPTFLVMKQYKIPDTKHQTQNIFHIDCYRVKAQDILDLGWKEIVADKKNLVIVEWAERIKSIIPKRAIWMSFGHKKNNEREITINSKFKSQK